MKKNAFKLASVLPFCVALAACGGGGGGAEGAGPAANTGTGGTTTTPPLAPVDHAKSDGEKGDFGQTGTKQTDSGKPGAGGGNVSSASVNSYAAGIWFGQDRNAQSSIALVAVDARYPTRSEYFIIGAAPTGDYGPSYSGWMEQQYGGLKSSHTLGPTFNSWGLAFAADPANTLRAKVYSPADDTIKNEYSMSYGAENLLPSSFDKLAGKYGSLNIDRNGALTGQIGHCAVSGKFELLDERKNMYKVSMDVDPQHSTCWIGLSSPQPFAVQGLAAIAKLPNQDAASLILGAADKDKSLYMLGGTFRKQ